MTQNKCALLLFLLLGSCAHQAQEMPLAARYENVATITCGNFNYDDVTRKNVMQRYECLSNLQKRMLVPSNPHPDLYLQAIALRGVAARKFHDGKISKEEFLYEGSQAVSYVVSESRKRDLQDIALQPQPIFIPSQPTPQIPTTRIQTTCRNTVGIGNPVTCESQPIGGGFNGFIGR